jgi:6-phosphogluconolactonase
VLDRQVLPDARSAAHVAAELIEHAAIGAVQARGRASIALSGGTNPVPMFEQLARSPLPWAQVHVLQVDERVAPDGDEARNATQQLAALGPVLPPGNLHLLPVDPGTDLDAAAARAEADLLAVCDGVIDCVHLGLGPDGHTASLFPGDPALDVTDRSVVAVDRPHVGYRRMTLTLPVLAAARSIVWLVTGSDKAPALAQLLQGDPAIPAGRVPGERAILVCDAAAAGHVA